MSSTAESVNQERGSDSKQRGLPPLVDTLVDVGRKRQGITLRLTPQGIGMWIDLPKFITFKLSEVGQPVRSPNKGAL